MLFTASLLLVEFEGVVAGAAVFDVAGEEVDAGLDVIFVDGFVDSVDIAGGD